MLGAFDCTVCLIFGRFDAAAGRAHTAMISMTGDNRAKQRRMDRA
jgi:hypothetical protein